MRPASLIAVFLTLTLGACVSAGERPGQSQPSMLATSPPAPDDYSAFRGSDNGFRAIRGALPQSQLVIGEGHGGRAGGPAVPSGRLGEGSVRGGQPGVGISSAPVLAPSGKPCITGPRGGTYTITKNGNKNYDGC